MVWKTLDDMELAGKRVLTRVDINVPVEDGVVTDATRITRIVPTINDIVSKGGTPVLLAHFGRPKGKVNEDMRLTKVGERLSELLGKEVVKVDDCVGEAVASAVGKMQNGDVLLLENVRFYPGEEKNDPEFAKQLASVADLYVNDAFGTAHRAHASTEGVTKYLSPSVAG